MYFTNLALGQYIPTNSFIHRLDPRAKLFSLLIIITAVFPAWNMDSILVRACSCVKNFMEGTVTFSKTCNVPCDIHFRIQHYSWLIQ